MIVSSGYNIAAPEVEAALASHDAVTESAVIGVPDIERGTVIKAIVVLRRGRQPCDAQIGRAPCRGSVCQYVEILEVAVVIKKKTIKNLYVNTKHIRTYDIDKSTAF